MQILPRRLTISWYLGNFHALRIFTVHLRFLKKKKKKKTRMENKNCRRKWKNWSSKNIEISSSIETITSLRNAEFITQYILTNRAIDNRTFHRLNTYNRYIPYFSISYIFHSIKNFPLLVICRSFFPSFETVTDDNHRFNCLKIIIYIHEGIRVYLHRISRNDRLYYISD